MSLLYWNCQRLGNQHTKNQLAEMVRVKDPSVVFIAETWTDEDRLKNIQKRLEFKYKFLVPRKNKAGGWYFFWKEEFKLEVQTFSKNHIDTTINKNSEDEWRFTDFYEEADTQKRHKSWNRLRSLKNRGSNIWICAGDFNEITRQSEKGEAGFSHMDRCSLSVRC